MHNAAIKKIDNLRNTCGTCERLKFENEVFRTWCKSLGAKGLNSRDSCHSDVDSSKIASSEPECTFSSNALDISTMATS
jgi:hypothetical protein